MRLAALAIFTICALLLAPAPNVAAQSGYSFQNQEFDNMREIMRRACDTPADYETLKRRIRSTASSGNARATGLVYPQRNTFHVSATDISAYEAYYPNACERSRRFSQCAASSLSAEQACDCIGGYIGGVSFGAGAGETIVSNASSRATGEAACAAAANRAIGSERARYTAQLGRVQLYQPRGTRTGYLTLQSAANAGYARANVDIARAHLRDLEFGGATDYERRYAIAASHLALARGAGAREIPYVLESFHQLAGVRRTNANIYRIWEDFNR